MLELDLVNHAKVSLEKAELGEHQAGVCLCLDISGSMHRLYGSESVQDVRPPPESQRTQR